MYKFYQTLVVLWYIILYIECHFWIFLDQHFFIITSQWKNHQKLTDDKATQPQQTDGLRQRIAELEASEGNLHLDFGDMMLWIKSKLYSNHVNFKHPNPGLNIVLHFVLENQVPNFCFVEPRAGSHLKCKYSNYCRFTSTTMNMDQEGSEENR